MSVQMRHSRVAETALSVVQQRAGSSDAKDYKTRTKNFPVMILQSGLAQAIGFLFAKAQKGERAYDLYKCDFLKVLRAAAPGLPGDDVELHKHILKADLDRYRQLSHYALEASQWLKRIAETAIPSGVGEEW